MLPNYRPISLTSIAGKAMEKIVVRRPNYYLETNGFIAKEQAGFRSSRSTNQHVALLSQCVKDSLDNNHVLTAVFIDLKSAYDNVWREYLLLKLSKLGIRANLFNWIKGFLCQRSFRVRYGSSLSKSKILKTGHPQGAVSSCSLFNIYINDLITKIKEIIGVKCLLYADDLVFCTVSKKVNAVKSIETKLSAALNALGVWCDTNNIEVNE
ncbi:reverse transcriptase domain-containing protein [Caerostris darwini]|uniref:Reverse transcriptase domain-containing protein n=1 Tax=Caerostris darwini TaxID=1538125 RepID=A0AAV4QIJ0_9ARAC|nr:reverse transcriptase domain-containing protein [Caerostris darwini]